MFTSYYKYKRLWQQFIQLFRLMNDEGRPDMPTDEHDFCPDCGFCVTCGDCGIFGCGRK